MEVRVTRPTIMGLQSDHLEAEIVFEKTEGRLAGLKLVNLRAERRDGRFVLVRPCAHTVLSPANNNPDSLKQFWAWVEEQIGVHAEIQEVRS